MAMKREYLSVDGEIFGEVTNGVVNFYDRDALGSVVAIEDGAGNTVSTIEYKPFGDVRTYTGENPLSSPRRFLWCGTWGYRFNERYAQYTSHYVRARHYSSLQGMWSTVDPLYPSERAYGYVEGRGMVVIDPSGMKGGWDLVLKGKCCATYTRVTSNAFSTSGVMMVCTKEEVRSHCEKLFNDIEYCKVPKDTFCNVVDRGKCCEISYKYGVSAACLCGILMSERSWADHDNFLKKSTDAIGYWRKNQRTTFGCNQMSTGTALSIIKNAKSCISSKKLLSKMKPDPSSLSSNQIASLIKNNCKWSSELAAIWLFKATDPSCNGGKRKSCSDLYMLWNGGDGTRGNLGPDIRRRAECVEKAMRNNSPC